jgi:hypothetical protein
VDQDGSAYVTGATFSVDVPAQISFQALPTPQSRLTLTTLSITDLIFACFQTAWSLSRNFTADPFDSDPYAAGFFSIRASL